MSKMSELYLYRKKHANDDVEVAQWHRKYRKRRKRYIKEGILSIEGDGKYGSVYLKGQYLSTLFHTGDDARELYLITNMLWILEDKGVQI